MKIDFSISQEEMLLRQIKAYFYTGVVDGAKVGTDVSFGVPTTVEYGDWNTSINVEFKEGSEYFTPSNRNVLYNRVPLSIFAQLASVVELETPTTDKPIQTLISEYLDSIRANMSKIKYTISQVVGDGFVDVVCSINPEDLIFIGKVNFRYFTEEA